MAQLLISVTSVDEAAIALACGADIIDLKDPTRGALGALPLDLISEVVGWVHAQAKPCMTSATIGDLPMQPDLLLEQVLAMSATNVDIIKIGFFKTMDSDYRLCLDALQSVCATGLKLVAVLFAEFTYPAGLIAAIANAGFYGVMLDTVEKNGKTFLDYMTMHEVAAMFKQAHSQGIMNGIAGSLCLQHVAIAKALEPDFIGFRGGVCVRNLRKAALAPEMVCAIREAI